MVTDSNHWEKLTGPQKRNSRALSFNHIVGAGEEDGWYGQVEGLR
jgi:hypothetical protein